jgi:hypothetical protein
MVGDRDILGMLFRLLLGLFCSFALLLLFFSRRRLLCVEKIVIDECLNSDNLVNDSVGQNVSVVSDGVSEFELLRSWQI